ncbi:MAG: bifunctional UDP-N-acetylglucosamine diphosphorylase/glucosamine-1-phosphate N-acetyltransferase GlmU [Bryobacterales bacterium]|nr:bifunctional UDP-N-acetylglucosamine diphosphorylase/glucosamine-1-phosphate N-acetyltransferase GlmU [Bryobacterales bacterium]
MDIPVNVLILAAGLGTRMKSKLAKVLHRAGGRTLIEHVVETASSLTAPERIFVVVGHQAEQVKETVAARGVRFVTQAEQKGTAHAVQSCRETAGGDSLVVVLYGDCPLLSAATLAGLIERQRASSAALTLLATELDHPAGYGRLLRGPDGSVEAVVEENAATAQQRAIREVNAGIYCFRGDLLWKHIGEILPDNPAGEFYLTDIVAVLRRAGHAVQAISHKDARELLGVNTRVDLAEADRVLRERTVLGLMLDGVSIERPETVTIDPQVRIGRDSAVGPFVQVVGNSRIGEGCRIGSCSIVENSILGDGVVVAPFTVIADSQLENNVQVGPFARLRPGNHLEARARVGNFVELKKTRLGEDSVAMHLSYLGDAAIGKRINIGAGTITCNYDGVKKHQTTIGDGAFVGSHSTLVAPVQIGPGSYVGAGSVITKEVPGDALAIGRSRQMNKTGWAKRRRERLQP